MSSPVSLNSPSAGPILVTGASRGLGLCLVRHLLDQGHAIVAVQRRISEALQELRSQHGERLSLHEFDLGQVEMLETQFREVWFPDDRPIGGLVNNAAQAYDDLVTNCDWGAFEVMQRVNCGAPLLLSRAAIRRMLLSGTAGSLVHVSSISAHTGFSGLAMYGGSKGFLEALSRGLAREWGSRGIRSNCVVPGFMETEMSQRLPAEQREKIFRRTALGRPTSLDSVAETVAFLLSDAAASVTGQAWVVDGGSR